MSESLLPEQLRARDYLLRKGTGASLDTLRRQLADAIAAIESAFDGVNADQRDRSPAPGKWSPHEILDHVVLSHQPAVAQLKSLFAGTSPEGVAIPADLHRDGRPPWTELRAQLDQIHKELISLLETASDDRSLEPKAVVEMVIKVDSQPKHWLESLDWKAFVQVIRVHTLEHDKQLQRTLSELAAK